MHYTYYDLHKNCTLWENSQYHMKFQASGVFKRLKKKTQIFNDNAMLVFINNTTKPRLNMLLIIMILTIKVST